MSEPLTRRSVLMLSAGAAVAPMAAFAQEARPVEAAFQRDYEAPGFKPKWKKPQVNRLLVEDFVIFCHSDIDMVKKLLEKDPTLVAATMDWGAGDWESGLGGASHMGRADIAKLLLSRGARIDVFCAAMLGQLEAVKAFIQLEPAIARAKGPHGFDMIHHAKAGGESSKPVLEYLQSLAGE